MPLVYVMYLCKPSEQLRSDAKVHRLLLLPFKSEGTYKTFVCVCSMEGQTVTALPPHRTKMTDPPRRKGEPRTWMT